MRKRYYRARVWLDEKEYAQFIKDVARSGLSRETYLRKLITGYVIKECPPLEYQELIRQLSAIGRNINQISTASSAVYSIDAQKYKENYELLLKLVFKIQLAVE